jgi:hypothetical protein
MTGTISFFIKPSLGFLQDRMVAIRRPRQKPIVNASPISARSHHPIDAAEPDTPPAKYRAPPLMKSLNGLRAPIFFFFVFASLIAFAVPSVSRKEQSQEICDQKKQL